MVQSLVYIFVIFFILSLYNLILFLHQPSSTEIFLPLSLLFIIYCTYFEFANLNIHYCFLSFFLFYILLVILFSILIITELIVILIVLFLSSPFQLFVTSLFSSFFLFFFPSSINFFRLFQEFFILFLLIS